MINKLRRKESSIITNCIKKRNEKHGNLILFEDNKIEVRVEKSLPKWITGTRISIRPNFQLSQAYPLFGPGPRMFFVKCVCLAEAGKPMK